MVSLEEHEKGNGLEKPTIVDNDGKGGTFDSKVVAIDEEVQETTQKEEYSPQMFIKHNPR